MTDGRLSLHERRTLRKQVKAAKYFDEHGGYANARTYEEYLQLGNGLEHFLNYAGRVATRLLDIGAGTAVAAKEISKRHPDLKICATVLHWDDEMQEILGNDSNVTIYQTPAEELRGIESESVGGMLAVVSTTYSHLPERTAQSMNRILRLGGAVKMVCIDPVAYEQEGYTGLISRKRFLGALALTLMARQDIRPALDTARYTERLNIYNAVTADRYAEIFQGLEYDVHASRHACHTLFTGIKPGYSQENGINARELYEQDRLTLNEQLAGLR